MWSDLVASVDMISFMLNTLPVLVLCGCGIIVAGCVHIQVLYRRLAEKDVAISNLMYERWTAMQLLQQTIVFEGPDLACEAVYNVLAVPAIKHVFVRCTTPEEVTQVMEFFFSLPGQTPVESSSVAAVAVACDRIVKFDSGLAPSKRPKEGMFEITRTGLVDLKKEYDLLESAGGSSGKKVTKKGTKAVLDT